MDPAPPPAAVENPPPPATVPLVNAAAQQDPTQTDRSASATEPSPELACDPSFIAWCSAHGLKAPAVVPAFVEEGWRGVIASTPIAPGDVLTEAPERLLMTGASARRDAVLGPLLQRPPYAQLSDHQVLVVHLLHEASKGPASFWAPYIRQLPRSYTTLCCFSPAAIEALQAPHAVAAASEAVEKAKCDWRGAWRLMQDLDLSKKWCCWAAWRWAASTVLSRTMFMPGGDKAGALTPFGDLFNYRPPPPPFTPRLYIKGTACPAAAPAEGAAQEPLLVGGLLGDDQQRGACGDGAFDEGDRTYRLYSRTSYAPGDQVFLCYGRATNLELLETYGFCLPPGSNPGSNPHDTAPLPPNLLPAPPSPPGIAAPSCWPPPPAACWLHADGAPGWDLLRALRVTVATPAERRTRAYLATEGRPVVESGDDTTVMAWLAAAASAALMALPTGLKEDLLELDRLRQRRCSSCGGGGDEQHESECLELALAWRLGYKTVLLRGTKLAETLESLPS